MRQGNESKKTPCGNKVSHEKNSTLFILTNAKQSCNDPVKKL